MFIGKVQEAFQFAGVGIDVVLDVTYEQLPENLKLKIGDEIELRSSVGVSVRSRIAGIEHANPWTPRRLFPFKLPSSFDRDQLQLGAEVWKLS